MYTYPSVSGTKVGGREVGGRDTTSYLLKKELPAGSKVRTVVLG